MDMAFDYIRDQLHNLSISDSFSSYMVFKLPALHCNHDPPMIGVNSSGNWPSRAPREIRAAHFNRDICAYIL